MKEKLTLDQTWEYCLAMWKWIAEQLKQDSNLDIWKLKARWIKEHQFRYIKHDCFFCEYAAKHNGYADKERSGSRRYCSACPGNLISKRFGCELYSAYDWIDSPLKFYQKLVELNEKRKKAKVRK